MLILIPAYEPDLRLAQLVAALRAKAPAASVLVVQSGIIGYLYQSDASRPVDVLSISRSGGDAQALRDNHRRLISFETGPDAVGAIQGVTTKL